MCDKENLIRKEEIANITTEPQTYDKDVKKSEELKEFLEDLRLEQQEQM